LFAVLMFSHAQNVFADLTVVCDGSFSALRRNLTTMKPQMVSTAIGIVMHNCPLPSSQMGHVVLAEPTPILLYQISTNETRVLIDIKGEVPPADEGGVPGYLRSKIAPQLPECVRTKFLEAVDANRIKGTKNQLLPVEPSVQAGAVLLGDAFNMRHPLTGGGMTVALSDVVVLRDMLAPIKSFSDKQSVMTAVKKFYIMRRPMASTINILSGALYEVFCATADENLPAMREACVEYLGMGGPFSAGPISLLGGLNPRPMTLIMHFYMVAIYGLFRMLFPFPTPARVAKAVGVIKAASKVMFPLLQREHLLNLFVPFESPEYTKHKAAHRSFRSVALQTFTALLVLVALAISSFEIFDAVKAGAPYSNFLLLQGWTVLFSLFYVATTLSGAPPCTSFTLSSSAPTLIMSNPPRPSRRGLPGLHPGLLPHRQRCAGAVHQKVYQQRPRLGKHLPGPRVGDPFDVEPLLVRASSKKKKMGGGDVKKSLCVKVLILQTRTGKLNLSPPLPRRGVTRRRKNNNRRAWPFLSLCLRGVSQRTARTPRGRFKFLRGGAADELRPGFASSRAVPPSLVLKRNFSARRTNGHEGGVGGPLHGARTWRLFGHTRPRVGG
jgi:hypothetical protein